ncbi:hypothetical protein [Falsiroseomonas selenitidurans]|uniref:Calcineurin-like phosphoesterase domain-containing protein n=1 Tax=Falsiroseomonas selenitidurans TaxID=2716335 RepID=A0ABX1E4Q6_9PROT|nr:hypothetical protein [Falsiroseomonas selenitidurans]NKC30747.1 hypothetical protein [Falsiroseomonas selenitidurans]
MRRLFLLAALSFASLPALAQRFDFVALGDMPYTTASAPEEPARYDQLIDRINALAPAFSIHVGDTKAGSTTCSDEALIRSASHFTRFAGAVVYTPGDNEWTDCHRANNGGFDPLDRLAMIRRTWFARASSLGQRPITLQRQADAMADRFASFVENARWTHNNVAFVTVHIVGSNNNFETRAGAPTEFAARDAANQAWLADSLARATQDGAIGAVIAFQADMWEERTPPESLQNGFARTIETLRREAARFGKPVLLVHGDAHRLRIDQPLRDGGRPPRTMENVTRLMVMGAQEVHAVRVTVDPAEPGLFSFTPLRVPENLAAPRF